ncbi:adenine deaminase [Fusibacter sp. A1]|nr:MULTISPECIES: adenine deaminase [unclassified Fusibacter]MCK8060937.1 adenine deaminase [Fusibacter sp. A2]NPE23233.1 adenine deaminase [Fusibacter sp. A1]RXV59622.1 adenine deaminase [Fusibacter sp. A1]
MKRRALLARGDDKVEMVLKNCKVINVFNGRIINANIAIDQGKIIGIGDYEGETCVDLGGKYVAPGLIDAHMHMESTLVAPDQMARIIVPRGTTTVVADPHEIANVLGMEGVKYMIDAAEETPLNGFFMLPSCVPATAFENAGAVLQRKELETLVDHKMVLGLGEVMNYPGVIGGDDDLLDKMDMADRMTIDGHGPTITGKDLNAYVINGIRTEHECTTLDEMEERIGLGMYVAIREGSAAKNLEALIKGVNERTKHQCMFCTDDKHPEDILKDGHIDYNVRRAIELGLDPVTAIQMATINPSRCYNLRDIGAIAPGYDADLIVFDNFENFSIELVYKKGQLVADKGKALFTPKQIPIDGVNKTVKLHDVTPATFELQLSGDIVNVIRITPGSIVTEHVVRRVHVDEAGKFKAHRKIDVAKIAVLERHGKTGTIGIGLVENFNLRGGAIATTIAHDSHNIIVIGDSDEDMAMAVNQLKEIEGGIVVVSAGQVCGSLALPIAGLMSSQPMEDVSETLRLLREDAYNKLGVSRVLEPFMTLSFLALPVIPELKITDEGLFDVSSFKHIGIDVNES